MNLFEFEDYREYLSRRIRAMPSRGKGEMKRLASALGVHPSLLSQIMKGQRDFTAEQSLALAGALGLSDPESEYLLTLVELARASSEKMRSLLRRRLKRMRAPDGGGGVGPSGRAPDAQKREVVLTEAERAVFYSNWFYSAVRLRSAIEPAPTLDVLASDLGLPRTLVRQVTEFLIEKGLCVEKGGRIRIGPSRTWIDQSSPLVLRHHQNWRLKGIDRMPKKEDQEFFLTLPMTIAKKDFARMRQAVLDFERAIHGILDETESEELVCLNVDLFRV